MSLPAEPSCQCLRAHAFVFVCVCVHVFVCPREEKEGERDGGGGHLLYARLFGDSRVDETRAICDPKPHSLREEAAIVITHTIFQDGREESGWETGRRESLREERGLRGRP